MTERKWTKLLVTTDKLNGARRGDIIELDDSVAVEYLIASGQCELVADEPATKPDKKPSKLGRRRNKE